VGTGYTVLACASTEVASLRRARTRTAAAPRWGGSPRSASILADPRRLQLVVLGDDHLQTERVQQRPPVLAQIDTDLGRRAGFPPPEEVQQRPGLVETVERLSIPLGMALAARLGHDLRDRVGGAADRGVQTVAQVADHVGGYDEGCAHGDARL
jgi:hypothetical protein